MVRLFNNVSFRLLEFLESQSAVRSEITSQKIAEVLKSTEGVVEVAEEFELEEYDVADMLQARQKELIDVKEKYNTIRKELDYSLAGIL